LLLPEFALPYLRFGIVVIALFLVARLLLGLTLKAGAESAKLGGDAQSAGAALGAPFPATDREVMRGSGCAHCSAAGAGLYLQSPEDVGVNRLDRSPSVSVCQPPRAPARLAGFSGSDRANRRVAMGFWGRSRPAGSRTFGHHTNFGLPSRLAKDSMERYCNPDENLALLIIHQAGFCSPARSGSRRSQTFFGFRSVLPWTIISKRSPAPQRLSGRRKASPIP
jgi:hypothetical protein